MLNAKVIKTLTTDIETPEEFLSFIKCAILVIPTPTNIKTSGLTVYPDYTDYNKVTEFEYLKYSVVAKLISIDEINPKYRLYIDVAFYTEADLEDSGYYSELQFTALIMYKNIRGSYELRKI